MPLSWSRCYSLWLTRNLKKKPGKRERVVTMTANAKSDGTEIETGEKIANGTKTAARTANARSEVTETPNAVSATLTVTAMATGIGNAMKNENAIAVVKDSRNENGMIGNARNVTETTMRASSNIVHEPLRNTRSLNVTSMRCDAT